MRHREAQRVAALAPVGLTPSRIFSGLCELRPGFPAPFSVGPVGPTYPPWTARCSRRRGRKAVQTLWAGVKEMAGAELHFPK